MILFEVAPSYYNHVYSALHIIHKYVCLKFAHFFYTNINLFKLSLSVAAWEVQEPANCSCSCSILSIACCKCLGSIFTLAHNAFHAGSYLLLWCIRDDNDAIYLHWLIAWLLNMDTLLSAFGWA